ncbi:MFS transporter [Ochrobactrum sp. BTU1]|nr:MFS transporter [Ochrobactrum sp. BTU1]
MLPVGPITSIAEALNISVGSAGLIVSVPAILAAFFAPFVVIVASDIDRRHILAGLLLLLTAANIASAMAQTFLWLLLARTAVGICMGGIWAVAGGLAPRLAPTQSVGLATAIIFGGVAAASVIGVPVGTMIGDSFGWRWAFGAMAVFSAIVLCLSLWVLPCLPVAQSIRPSQFIAELKRSSVQFGLLLTGMLVAGHFMAYTFITPALQTISGVSPEWIAGLLFIFGLAGIIGNFLLGTIARKWLGISLGTIAIGLLTAILGFAALGGTPAPAISLLVLWGLAYGGVSVTLQSWMMKAAPSAIEIATALFVSVFNIAIATGSFIGGQTIDAIGLRATLFISAIFPAVALLLMQARQWRY